MTAGDSITLVASDAMCSVAEMIEQPDPVAEQDGRDMDLHLIDEPGLQVLLDGVRATRNHDFAPPGLTGLCQGTEGCPPIRP